MTDGYLWHDSKYGPSANVHHVRHSSIRVMMVFYAAHTRVMIDCNLTPQLELSEWQKWICTSVKDELCWECFYHRGSILPRLIFELLTGQKECYRNSENLLFLEWSYLFHGMCVHNVVLPPFCGSNWSYHNRLGCAVFIPTNTAYYNACIGIVDLIFIDISVYFLRDLGLESQQWCSINQHSNKITREGRVVPVGTKSPPTSGSVVSSPKA